MLLREKYIDEIVNRLSWINSTVQLRNSLNLYDIDIHLESLFCELLNFAFGYRLENLNYTQANYASIDLADRSNRIAVQVTSQNTSVKVQETLDKFFKNEHEKEYDRLIILIMGAKPKFRKPFRIRDGFHFDATTDIWDTNYIIKEISKKTDEELSYICDFFERKLYPNKGYTGLSLNKIGTEKLNEMYSICKAKLLSIGISDESADEIIVADIGDKKYQYILDAVENKKCYLIGEFGSGKSHALLVLAQRLMKEYISDDSTVFPVYIQGKDLARTGSIKQWIKDQKLDSVSWFLIIDGLDEIEGSLAEQFIEEINVLSVQYPQNKILVASRPLTILGSETGRTFNIRPLEDEECVSLYNIISGDEDGEQAFHWISDNMRKTLTKPFFCIIFAQCKSEPKGWAKHDIDLIIALVTKSMKKAGSHVEAVFTDLMNIAIKIVDRNFADVHISEIYFSSSVEKVLATGFISLSNDYISCPLPIVAQWMAAEAIRHNMVSIDDIICSSYRISRWLYSLSILFSQITFEESLDFFTKIIKKSPGTAARIIRDGIRFESIVSLPSAHECGEKILKTMQIWTNALDPLSKWIAPLSQNGLRPLGIDSNGGRIVFSWLREEFDDYPIHVLPFEEMEKKGTHIYGRPVPAQATWPWIVTFEYLSDNLKTAIENHTIVPYDGQLQKEYLWHTLRFLSGKRAMYNGSIDLTSFDRYRQYIGKRLLVNGRKIDVSGLFCLIDNYLVAGETTLDTPYPLPDKHNSSNWVWSNYSAERLMEKTQFVYGTALLEYMQIVDTIFAKFKDSLRIALLAPCKLVGRLKFHENGTTYADAPGLFWYIEALPKDKKNCIDIQFEENASGVDSDAFETLFRHNLKLRPEAENKNITHITSGYLDLFNDTPVTNVVFSWLKNELKAIGWIK